MAGKANIVGMLWLAVGMTACLAVLATGYHVQRAKVISVPSHAKILKTKHGVRVKSSDSDAWRLAAKGDPVYSGDILATDEDQVVIDAGSGRRLEVGPSSRVSFAIVSRPNSGKFDLQVILKAGFLVAEQPKSCPCGTLIVRTAGSSFEVHRKERLGVQLLPNSKGQEFDPARGPAFRSSEVRELRIPGVSRPDELQIPHPVADATFGREWWIDRPWNTLQSTTINIPLEPPRSRPDLNFWRPFIEVSEPTGFMERVMQDTSISTRPRVLLRVNTIMSVSAPVQETGISKIDFRLRGGFKTRDPNGDRVTLGSGTSPYRVMNFGEELQDDLTIALDQLRPGFGNSWFPAKPALSVDSAPFQITLPKGEVPAGLGRYIRGANRVGWTKAIDNQREGTVITSRGELVAMVRGPASEQPEVSSLRRSLGGDLAIRGSLEDVVMGTPQSVAQQVFSELNAGKPFYSARYNRVTPLDPRRFPNQQSLENFLKASGSTILKKELPVL